MKKKIVITIIIILVALSIYVIVSYIKFQNEKSLRAESENRLKDCYELVKRDIQIEQLNFPETIEFPEYNDLECAKNTSGNAIITFWVKYKISKVFNELDSIQFAYSMNDKGEFKLISKSANQSKN